MVTTLAIANYRSLHRLELSLGRLNVVTGANGSGKSNLYRALRLLAATARGGAVAALAEEGGLQSALWAGPETISRRMRNGEVEVQGGRRRAVVALRMGFSGEDFGYAIDLGFPVPDERSQFNFDPEIKRECLFSGGFLRPSNLLVDRRGQVVSVRDGREWRVLDGHLDRFRSIFEQIADPERAPEVLRLREQVRAWRFYDHFRSDADAPARQERIGTRTLVLSPDGRDLAAAWQTIREIGDAAALDAAVDDAFPGAKVEVEVSQGRFGLRFSQHGLLRPLATAELSDGTLRYLLWIAALLTPRPPPLMVLNEPETSLHPDLLAPLGRLIAACAQRTQVWVVTHAPRLIAVLEAAPDCSSIPLDKPMSETVVAGRRELDEPRWEWPAR
jgi:predicted ATPase